MLTEKQKAFCQEYTVDFNGRAAAMRAGYSKIRAKVTASELMDLEDIIAEVNRIITERNTSTEDAAQRVIRELESIAFAKTTDFVNVKDMIIGRGKTRKKIRVAYVELTSDLAEENQRAIAEIRQTKDGIAIKAHDKSKALELLGRHYGIFEKDNSQSKPVFNLGTLPVTFE